MPLIKAKQLQDVLSSSGSIYFSGTLSGPNWRITSSSISGSFEGNGSQLTDLQITSVPTSSYISPIFISSSMSEAGFGDIRRSDLNEFATTASVNLLSSSLSAEIASIKQETASYVRLSQTASLSVATASYISPTFISASAAASGFGQGGASITDYVTTASFNSFTSSLNVKTGSIDAKISGLELFSSSLNTKTSSLDASIVSLNSQTASYVLNSQTASMTVATASYSLFANEVVESRDYLIVREHFIGGATVGTKTNDWWFPSGNGTVTAFQKTNFIGGVNLQTGTGGTGQQIMYQGAYGGSYTFTGIVFRSSSISVQFKSLVSPILIPTASGENTGMLIGFVDSAATGTLTNGFRFEYFFSGSAVTWFCRTASASLSTLVNTGVTVARGSDYYLSARVQGTTASFYINSELVATSSTNIPTNVYLSPLFSARITGYRSGGGGNHQLGIDYFDYKIQYPAVTQNLVDWNF